MVASRVTAFVFPCILLANYVLHLVAGLTSSDHYRVRRDTSQQMVCNSDSLFKCTCVDCNVGGTSSVGCCGTVLPSVIVKQAVLVTISNYQQSQLTTSFENNLKTSVKSATIRYCGVDPVGLCNKNVPANNNLTATVIVLYGNRPSGTSTLEVAMAVLLELEATTGSARKRRSLEIMETPTKYLAYGAFSGGREKRSVTASDVQSSDVMTSTTLIQVISNQSAIMSSELQGVVVSSNAKVYTADIAGTGNSPMAAIIVGSIFGIIFLPICIISARKAIRDRAAMKTRIENRKVKRQKLTNEEDEERVHANGMPPSYENVTVNNEGDVHKINAETSPKSPVLSNTVTVEAEICQTSFVGNGNINGDIPNGHPGQNVGMHDDGVNESSPKIYHDRSDQIVKSNSQFTSQDSNISLPNGHQNGLPPRHKTSSDDESALSCKDVTWSDPQNNEIQDSRQNREQTRTPSLQSLHRDTHQDRGDLTRSVNGFGIDNLSFDVGGAE